MTSGPPPMCLECKRFRPDADTLSCDAFPDRIPVGILDGEVDHRKPIAGDHGLQFVPNSDEVRPRKWWPNERGDQS